MLVRVLSVCLLCVLGALAPAAADEEADTRIASALCAPLDGVRHAARAQLAKEPERARRLARIWVTDPRAGLRQQAWIVLGDVGVAEDVAPALAAARSARQSAVASSAAQAAIGLAGRFLHADGPWLPRESALPPDRVEHLHVPSLHLVDLV